ncbi:hypothetical protein C4K68_14940 [Pokkaliibacter plantistimulans]|uniref:Uncharacterized protein n=1 Tax=Proteobacteria bacterium 228 TaxID=2083153 RepID=A0A2S5KNW7_9PROT|nr:hypothetical protein [Pokkaliibacter plantistimulans]PPC76534.1 hypothetical protein C4K68_14940 [Pokkaliibacter plantistimulans]
MTTLPPIQVVPQLVRVGSFSAWELLACPSLFEQAPRLSLHSSHDPGTSARVTEGYPYRLAATEAATGRTPAARLQALATLVGQSLHGLPEEAQLIVLLPETCHRDTPLRESLLAALALPSSAIAGEGATALARLYPRWASTLQQHQPVRLVALDCPVPLPRADGCPLACEGVLIVDLIPAEQGLGCRAARYALQGGFAQPEAALLSVFAQLQHTLDPSSPLITRLYPTTAHAYASEWIRPLQQITSLAIAPEYAFPAAALGEMGSLEPVVQLLHLAYRQHHWPDNALMSLHWQADRHGGRAALLWTAAAPAHHQEEPHG